MLRRSQRTIFLAGVAGISCMFVLYAAWTHYASAQLSNVPLNEFTTAALPNLDEGAFNSIWSKLGAITYKVFMIVLNSFVQIVSVIMQAIQEEKAARF